MRHGRVSEKHSGTPGRLETCFASLILLAVLLIGSVLLGMVTQGCGPADSGSRHRVAHNSFAVRHVTVVPFADDEQLQGGGLVAMPESAYCPASVPMREPDDTSGPLCTCCESCIGDCIDDE